MTDRRSEIARNLRAFVPDFACRSEFAKLGEVPYLRQEPGAVALVDISGFTPLTERLSKRGHRGVELLTETLNRFFSVAIETIYEHGGDVVKFAGDALLISFRPVDAADEGRFSSRLRASSKLRKEIAKIEHERITADTVHGTSNQVFFIDRASSTIPPPSSVGATATESSSKMSHFTQAGFESMKPLSKRAESSSGFGESHASGGDYGGETWAHKLSRFRRSGVVQNGFPRVAQVHKGAQSSKEKNTRATEKGPFEASEAACAEAGQAAEEGGRDVAGTSRSQGDCLPSDANRKSNNLNAEELNIGGQTADTDPFKTHDSCSTDALNRYGIFGVIGGMPFEVFGEEKRCFVCRDALEQGEKSNHESGYIFTNCACCGILACPDCICVPVRQLDHNDASTDATGSPPWIIAYVCLHCAQSSSRIVPQGRENLRQVALRCVQCCLLLQKKLDGYQGLRLHVGASVGNVGILHVGGILNRWELTLSGEALKLMSIAEGLSEAGEVCVHGDMWKLVEKNCKGQQVIDSGKEEAPEIWKVTSIDRPPPAIPIQERLLNASGDGFMKALVPEYKLSSSLLRFVPGGVQEALIRGHSTAAIATLRRASIIFINLPSIIYNEEPQPLLNTVQVALTKLQLVLYSLEGMLRQFIVDDKGTTCICAFGLFPSHENDPMLAALCALRMVQELDVEGIPAKIGVTTGAVFAGMVGSEARCEFALVGDVVNLSARLMAAALKMQRESEATLMPVAKLTMKEKRIDVLCCAVTHKNACQRLIFRKLDPIYVKGKFDAVAVFSPVREKEAGERLSFMSGYTSHNRESQEHSQQPDDLVATTEIPSTIEKKTEIEKTRKTSLGDEFYIEREPMFGSVHVKSHEKLIRGAQSILEDFSATVSEKASEGTAERSRSIPRQEIGTNINNLQGFLVVLEGEAGVGKTKVLLSWLQTLAVTLREYSYQKPVLSYYDADPTLSPFAPFGAFSGLIWKLALNQSSHVTAKEPLDSFDEKGRPILNGKQLSKMVATAFHYNPSNLSGLGFKSAAKRKKNNKSDFDTAAVVLSAIFPITVIWSDEANSLEGKSDQINEEEVNGELHKNTKPFQMALKRVAKYSHTVRTRILHGLCVRIICLARLPHFCVIDNAHNIDKESLRLALKLARFIDEQKCHTVLVMTTRPVLDSISIVETSKKPLVSILERRSTRKKLKQVSGLFAGRSISESTSKSNFSVGKTRIQVPNRRKVTHRSRFIDETSSLSTISVDFSGNKSFLQNVAPSPRQSNRSTAKVRRKSRRRSSIASYATALPGNHKLQHRRLSKVRRKSISDSASDRIRRASMSVTSTSDDTASQDSRISLKLVNSFTSNISEYSDGIVGEINSALVLCRDKEDDNISPSAQLQAESCLELQALFELCTTFGFEQSNEGQSSTIHHNSSTGSQPYEFEVHEDIFSGSNLTWYRLTNLTEEETRLLIISALGISNEKTNLENKMHRNESPIIEGYSGADDLKIGTENKRNELNVSDVMANSNLVDQMTELCPNEFVIAVHNLTDGNPLCLMEYLGVFRERALGAGYGAEVFKGSNVASTLMSIIQEVPLPDSLAGITTCRIDGLSNECRWVLQVASAVGEHSSLGMLAQVIESCANLHGEEEIGSELDTEFNIGHKIESSRDASRSFISLDDHLDFLCNVNLLRLSNVDLKDEHDIKSYDPSSKQKVQFSFVSEFIKKAAYGMLTFATRKLLHRSIVDILKTRYEMPTEKPSFGSGKYRTKVQSETGNSIYQSKPSGDSSINNGKYRTKVQSETGDSIYQSKPSGDSSINYHLLPSTKVNSNGLRKPVLISQKTMKNLSERTSVAEQRKHSSSEKGSTLSSISESSSISVSSYHDQSWYKNRVLDLEGGILTKRYALLGKQCWAGEMFEEAVAYFEQALVIANRSYDYNHIQNLGAVILALKIPRELEDEVFESHGEYNSFNNDKTELSLEHAGNLNRQYHAATSIIMFSSPDRFRDLEIFSDSFEQLYPTDSPYNRKEHDSRSILFHRLRAARWLRYMGKSCLFNSQLAGAASYFIQALQLLGCNDHLRDQLPDYVVAALRDKEKGKSYSRKVFASFRRSVKSKLIWSKKISKENSKDAIGSTSQATGTVSSYILARLSPKKKCEKILCILDKLRQIVETLSSLGAVAENRTSQDFEKAKTLLAFSRLAHTVGVTVIEEGLNSALHAVEYASRFDGITSQLPISVAYVCLFLLEAQTGEGNTPERSDSIQFHVDVHLSEEQHSSQEEIWSILLEISKSCVSMAYTTGDPDVIADTMHVVSQVAGALGKIQQAFEWMSESISLAQVLKDVSTCDNSCIAMAHLKLLSGDYADSVELVQQLSKSHGDDFKHFSVMARSAVLGIHVRVTFDDMNEARELAANASDLLVYSGHLTDSLKANILSACVLVDIYSHNLSLESLAVAMNAVEKVFQVSDLVENMNDGFEQEASTSENLDDTSAPNVMMLASSFQLESIISLSAMMKVLLAILCNHHVLHTGAISAQKYSETRFLAEEATMPVSEEATEEDLNLWKGSKSMPNLRNKSNQGKFFSRFFSKTNKKVQLNKTQRKSFSNISTAKSDSYATKLASKKSSRKRLSTYVDQNGMLKTSSVSGSGTHSVKLVNGFQMHHNLRFFMLGLGKGLSATEDMCECIGVKIDIIKNSVELLLRLMHKASRRFPVYAPEFEWYMGIFAWANGHLADAILHWEKQLHLATLLGLKWHMALAHFELARASYDWYNSVNGTSDDGKSDFDDRRDHLAKAQNICKNIKAKSLLRRVEVEMKISTREECNAFALNAINKDSLGAPAPVYSTIANF